jgi:hypothetical protein
MGLWRDFLGLGQDEIWAGLARDINADFTPGAWFKRGRIDLRKNKFIITLDTFETGGKNSQIYTRMRCPFINGNNLGMNIYREGIFSWLGKAFGNQDIVTGDEFFDDEFVVQGAPEGKIIEFLADEKLKGLIQRRPEISYGIKKDDGWFGRNYPEGVDVLQFQCYGLITNEPALKELFELFFASIDRLAEIDDGCDFSAGVTPK